MTTSSAPLQLDLGPATAALATVIRHLADEQLRAPTPCENISVGALVNHADGLAQAFIAAAHKTPVPGTGGIPEPTDPEPGWRTRVPERLQELAEAWRDPDAWTGMTAGGGVEMPSGIAGLVALDEVLVHGWDIATATGQPFDADPHLVAAALQWVQPTVEASPTGIPGLFGPPVAVPDDPTPLHRLLGLTGRDPGWRPEQ